MFFRMYDECIKKNLDIVVCDYCKETNGNKEAISFFDFGITTLNDMPSLLLDINLAPWNKLYKKSLFDDSTYFPINVKYEDTPFVALMLSKAKEIGKVNMPMYHYIVHSNSETTVVDERVFDIFKITDILLDSLGNNKHIKSSVYDLIVYLITTYTISQRYVKDKSFRDNFIDKAFLYLDENIHDYKKSNYFKRRNILKRIIEKNKFLTKLYCDVYVLLKNVLFN